MSRGLVAFIVLTLVGLGLTGCGLFRFEQREPWRTQAEQACLSQHLVTPTAYMALSSKIDGPGACGMDYPFKVAAFSEGSIALKSKVTLACPIIPQIETWLEEVVKPAAIMYFGVPLADLRAGSYSCRSRNNLSGAKKSEHAFGNALDVMAFALADGREITVVKGWKGDPAEQEFLREVFVGACRHFTTVLAPGSDQFHYDHIHLDLARHNPRGDRSICKPILKFTPRIAPENAKQILMSAGAAPDLPATDVEEDISEDAPMTPRPYTPSTARAPQLSVGGGFSADLPGPGGNTYAPVAQAPIPSPRPSPTYAAPLPLRPQAGSQSRLSTEQGIY
ncbi:extensin family protein [Microvirga sp. 2MCAF38]|uniref:extensin-like domain-containing protein n=1 Tax=Microvirga sp. 2MCAF38 TaxID=3232989 RepID=UPI003F9D4B5B